MGTTDAIQIGVQLGLVAHGVLLLVLMLVDVLLHVVGARRWKVHRSIQCVSVHLGHRVKVGFAFFVECKKVARIAVHEHLRVECRLIEVAKDVVALFAESHLFFVCNQRLVQFGTYFKMFLFKIMK